MSDTPQTTGAFSVVTTSVGVSKVPDEGIITPESIKAENELRSIPSVATLQSGLVAAQTTAVVPPRDEQTPPSPLVLPKK